MSYNFEKDYKSWSPERRKAWNSMYGDDAPGADDYVPGGSFWKKKKEAFFGSDVVKRSRKVMSAGLFFNIFMWLLLFGVAFFVYRFVSSFFSKSKSGELDDLVKNEILNKSTDRMVMGDSYYSASKYLFENLYDTSNKTNGIFVLFPWLSKTDHAAVGNYMLKVRPSEFTQLNNTYSVYKKEHLSWYESGKHGDLRADLLDLFSSSEQTKYLSHLGIL